MFRGLASVAGRNSRELSAGTPCLHTAGLCMPLIIIKVVTGCTWPSRTCIATHRCVSKIRHVVGIYSSFLFSCAW